MIKSFIASTFEVWFEFIFGIFAWAVLLLLLGGGIWLFIQIAESIFNKEV